VAGRGEEYRWRRGVLIGKEFYVVDGVDWGRQIVGVIQREEGKG